MLHIVVFQAQEASLPHESKKSFRFVQARNKVGSHMTPVGIKEERGCSTQGFRHLRASAQ